MTGDERGREPDSKDLAHSETRGAPGEFEIPPAVPRDPAERRKFIIALAALAALTFVAFLPVLRAGYIWDDGAVYENPLLRTAGGLIPIWAAPSQLRNFESHYWPLVYTSFWVEFRLYGDSVLGHHLVNLLLHIANVVLLWLVLRRSAVPGAWLAAALFGLHPVHVESVAWIIERKDVLSMLFYLSAFLSWIRFEERRKTLAYAGAVVLLACAMLSKSITISFPITVLLWVWWKRGRVTRADVVRVVPFFVVAVGLGALDVVLARGVEPVSLPLTLFDRALVAGRALWFYGWKLIWPLELMALYPRWQWSAGGLLPYVFPLGVAAVLGVLWFKRGRLGRGPLVAVLFFCITLGPVLGFVLYSFMTYSYVADRFQYLASAGLLTLAAAAATTAARRNGELGRRILAVGAGAVLAGLGILTWRQTTHYRNLETFWAYNYRMNATYTAASALGDIYFRQGDLERGEQLNLESLAIRDGARTRFRLGEVYSAKGDYDKALEQFLRAEEINQGTNRIEPLDPGLFFNIGRLYWMKAEWEKSLDYWQRSLKADPSNSQTREWLQKAEERLSRQTQRNGN